MAGRAVRAQRLSASFVEAIAAAKDSRTVRLAANASEGRGPREAPEHDATSSATSSSSRYTPSTTPSAASATGGARKATSPRARSSRSEGAAAEASEAVADVSPGASRSVPRNPPLVGITTFGFSSGDADGAGGRASRPRARRISSPNVASCVSTSVATNTPDANDANALGIALDRVSRGADC